MSSFDFRGLPLHGPLGFHGPYGIRQQGTRVECTHGQAPRLGPHASGLGCGELAENLQVPRRSPHKRRKVPAVVAVAAVTAGAAVVAAAAATAAESSLPRATDGVGRVAFRTSTVPAPYSAAGASRVAGSTGGPPPSYRDRTRCPSHPSSLRRLDAPSLLAPSPAVDSPSSEIGGSCCGGAGGAECTCSGVRRPGDGLP